MRGNHVSPSFAWICWTQLSAVTIGSKGFPQRRKGAKKASGLQPRANAEVHFFLCAFAPLRETSLCFATGEFLTKPLSIDLGLQAVDDALGKDAEIKHTENRERERNCDTHGNSRRLPG